MLFQCKDKTVLVVDIRPKYGCQQLFWCREHKLAEIAQGSTTNDYYLHITDTQILKWFQNENDIDISYRSGIGEAMPCFFWFFFNYLFRLRGRKSFPNKPWFLSCCSTSLENTVGKGEIAHNEFSAIFVKSEIFVCKLFQFGRV